MRCEMKHMIRATVSMSKVASLVLILDSSDSTHLRSYISIPTRGIHLPTSRALAGSLKITLPNLPCSAFPMPTTTLYTVVG